MHNQTSNRGDGKTTLLEKIPTGYRPNSTQTAVAFLFIGNSFETGRHLAQIISSDGTMISFSKGMNASPISVSFSLSWITTDSWPK